MTRPGDVTQAKIRSAKGWVTNADPEEVAVQLVTLRNQNRGHRKARRRMHEQIKNVVSQRDAARRERDFMRDAIREAWHLVETAEDTHHHSRTHALAAAAYELFETLGLDTGSPLVDLSATTEQETEK